MTGWDVVILAFSSGVRICSADADASALPDAVRVGVGVSPPVGEAGVAVGVAVGVNIGVAPAVGVSVNVGNGVLAPLVPLMVIFAGAVPTSTFAVSSFKPPTNVLEAN